jgi:hypothetical protein
MTGGKSAALRHEKDVLHDKTATTRTALAVILHHFSDKTHNKSTSRSVHLAQGILRSARVTLAVAVVVVGVVPARVEVNSFDEL